jgi:hypothetical protein
MLQRCLQNREALFGLFLCNDKRRQQADYIAVHACGDDQQPMLVAIGQDALGLLFGRRLGRVVSDQLDGLHCAHATYVADERKAPLPLLCALAKDAAKFYGPLVGLLRVQNLERCQCRRARYRIAAKRATQLSRPRGIHYLRASGHRG